MDDIKFSWAAFGAFILILIATVFTSTEEKKTVEMNLQEYCSMVDLYKQTKGEQGWPDFANKYRENCY